MKIAVTGGSGNIGYSVSKRLVELGHSVVVLDKRPPRTEGVRFVYLDLRNREVLQPVLEGCDAVVHLGELPHAHAGESPQQVYATNCVIGSTVMQTAADLKSKRLIYTSTCQVYGQWGTDPDLTLPLEKFPMDETQPLRPRNPYGLSKASNERFAEIVSRQFGLSIAIFRLPYVVPDKWGERWLRWQRDNQASYHEQADGFWTFVHVEDVADAYARALESPRAGCEAYHLFSEDLVGNVPLRERLEKMRLSCATSVPEDWPVLAPPVTTAKARDHLGWRPRHSWASLMSALDRA
jgi:nucleoside-diphosphate-sugar epimerase